MYNSFTVLCSVQYCAVLSVLYISLTAPQEGLTPLWYAIEKGSAELVGVLLDAHADVELVPRGDKLADTALLRAVRLKRVDIVALLLESARAKISACDKVLYCAYTPLLSSKRGALSLCRDYLFRDYL